MTKMYLLLKIIHMVPWDRVYSFEFASLIFTLESSETDLPSFELAHYIFFICILTKLPDSYKDLNQNLRKKVFLPCLCCVAAVEAGIPSALPSHIERSGPYTS